MKIKAGCVGIFFKGVQQKVGGFILAFFSTWSELGFALEEHLDFFILFYSFTSIFSPIFGFSPVSESK